MRKKKESTFGNVVDNGSHVDKAKTPPSVCVEVNAKENNNNKKKIKKQTIKYLHE